VDFSTELGHEVATAFRVASGALTGWLSGLDDMSAKLTQVFPFLKTLEDLLNNANKAATGGGPAKAPPGDWWAKEGAALAAYKTQLDKLLATKPAAAGPRSVTDPGSLARSKTGTGPADDTAKRLADATAALANAMKGQLQAVLSLTTDIDARAELERQIAQKELEASVAELEKKRGEAEADKGLKGPQREATLRKINADLDAAETADRTAEADKELLIARQATVAKIERDASQADREAQLRADSMKQDADHLTALANLAGTTKERDNFERLALDRAQAREDALAQAQVDRAAAELRAATAANDAAKVAEAQTALARAMTDQAGVVQAHQDQRTQQARDQEDPFTKYARSVQDFGKTVADDGVKAFNDLADGLADAVVHAKNLGDVAKNVFQQLAVDLISALLKKELFSFLIPGMAAGGVSAGGLTLVGERGPELVNLPGGSNVIPNSSLRNVSIGGGAGGQPVFVFDNRGAVIWEQAARSMMAYADRTSAMAGYGAVQASRRTVPAEMARAGGRSLR
jgi:hypothetical protein